MIRLLLFIISIISSHICFATGLRLGIIDSQNTEPYFSIRTHLIKELNKMGLKERKNLSIKSYSIGNHPGAVKNIWKYNLKGKIDILYISGTMATIGARDYVDQKDIPIVFAAPTDPVGIGVIKDLHSTPSGNFTGIPFQVKVENRLDLIKKVFPKVRRIGLIFANMPQSISYNKWLKVALKNPKYKNITVTFKKVQFIRSERGQERMAEVARGIAKELNEQVDLFLTPNDQMGTQRPFITELIKVVDKPIIGIAVKDIVEDWGSVLSISASLEDIGRKGAHIINRIFKGESVQDIYPLFPKEVIRINGKKANELGIIIPKELREHIVL